MNAIAEYLDLWRTLQDVILNDQPNRTIWHWTPDGIYTSKSAYMMLHAGSAKFRGHRSTHLEDVGSTESEGVPMASIPKMSLDG